MKNKKTLILSIVAIVALVCITVGISLAFFNYAQAGTTDNTLETGNITFLYTETSEVGRGIAIEDAFPISNEEGKLLTGEGNIFDFNISSTTASNTNIPFEITARKNSDSTLSEDVVVMYLTKVNGTNEEEILLEKYNNLTQTEKTSSYTEKTLYNGTVYSDTEYDQDYRLRMWITNDGTFEASDMGKTFTVTVNVYSNATVVTESDKLLENNNNVTSVSVNNTELVKAENKSYDYEVKLEEGTTSATLNIETEVPNAKVNVEKMNNLVQSNSITKLSTQVILTDLVNGTNLFKITVVSANEKVEDEYILNVYVGKDNFSSTILNNNTLVISAPTLTTSSSETNENGLYSSTATNSGSPTYYFRGNVKNNYVSFAGFTWRIIRINEDDTVRLILANINFDSPFNTSYRNYTDMYYTNSTIKSTLNSWYVSNLTDYNDKIVTGNYFCEEAKVKRDTNYASGNADMVLPSSYTPNFKCSTDANGYGIVNSNIGLITYDEIAYAGGSVSQSNKEYYLYCNTRYWTMSPAGIRYANAWFMYDDGYILNGDAFSSLAVRPVINLKANVTVTGTGTSTDPYVVE